MHLLYLSTKILSLLHSSLIIYLALLLLLILLFSIWYKNAADAKMEYNDKIHMIKDIISREITGHKSDLAQVKTYIAEKFNKSLGTIDNAYIERKYIKYCARFWLQETINFLAKLTERESRTIIQKVLNALDDIQALGQIPSPLNQLEYYKLLTKPEHIKCINKEHNKILINQFKKKCLEQIVAYSDSAEKELVFSEIVVDFLSTSENLQLITAELKLKDVCYGKLPFNELLERIMKLEVSVYGKNLTALREVSTCLQQEKDLLLIDKFKEVLCAYIKPTEIEEKGIDGRLVVEVIGKNIVVSEIVKQLENKILKNPNIEEVRFVGADIIHIDADFRKEEWHGKNIVVLTRAIKIHNKVTWDVSGKDNDRTYCEDAGTGEDGHGKQGKDGCPGESGGNVLILVERIENPEQFTIISNGGKGSKGQDGGTGRDGKDGKGITKEDFKVRFPSVVKFASHILIREKLVLETLKKIKDDSMFIREWPPNIEDCFRNSEDCFHNSEGCFIEGKTNQGNEITFSYCHGSFTSCVQAFLLYKGSLGQPGGHGGECGLGGQGGYVGEITVKNLESTQEFNVIISTKQGEEGGRGRGGLYGNHGKNGWDMGYMDYQFWKETQFYGQYENRKLTLEYYRKDRSDRVWCPFKDRYADITPTYIEHKKEKKYEERKSTRQNSDRQHHAQAVRKKNISQSSILAKYSNHLSSIEKSTMQNLWSNLQNTRQQALQAITKNQEQQEEQSTELRIKRHTPYQNKNEHRKGIITAISSTTYRENVDVEGLIDILKDNPSSLDDWFQLKKMVLSLSQLNQLFAAFKALGDRSTEMRSSQNDTESSKLYDIEKLLIDKYRLATLQEIAKQLPPYEDVVCNPELTSESAIRYLIEGKEKDNNISHPVLGTLNQYLY
jgi:hypothetical protein